MKSELLRIAGQLEPEEIRLRVAGLSRPVSVRVKAQSADEVEAALKEARADLNNVIDELAQTDGSGLGDQFGAAREVVAQIVRAGKQLEMFRGKEILKAFFETHVKVAIPGRKAFEYAIAREAARRPRLHQLVAEPVRRIERFVPKRLVELLDGVAQQVGEGDVLDQVGRLASDIRQAREQWVSDGNVEADFEQLRSEVIRIAALLPDLDESKGELVVAAAQLGVRSASM